jgi:hypothetical protein
MSLGHVRRATFLCPAMLTGGPEAIHQAAQVLTEQGVPTDIAYYGEGASLHLEDGQLLVTPPPDNPCLAAYARYEPVVCRRILLRRQHLVVLPEAIAFQAAPFSRATVAVWWLSVDNGSVPADLFARRAFFADRALTHFTQSEYAADFLRAQGVTRSYPLGDYTDPAFTELTPAGPNPDPVVAHNPAKGAGLAEAFFTGDPAAVALPLRGMSKDGIGEALRRARVYVEFGHLPGKDRLPREAAAAGAVVFVRRLGAGRFAGDFPLPDFYRFDEADVASGELSRRVAEVQADPAPHWAAQAGFRNRIRGERAELADQFRVIRGRRTAA